MIFRIFALLAFMTLYSFPSPAIAATYNWYFSNDSNGNAVGNDTTGDGTIGKPWKTLQKAENVMKVKNSGDVVNLYFDRGDTWNFATNVFEVFSVEKGDPVVHIRAYGSEALSKPIFKGDISNFRTANDDGNNGYHRYNRVFNFEVKNCSVNNVNIKNAYGNAIFLNDADGFTLSNSVISNVGYSFIDTKSSYGAEGVTIEYNTLHTGMQLHRFDKIGPKMWSQGISLFAETGGPFRNNLVQYNLIYDVAGEGICAPNSTVQYNVVGDTSSIGIDVAVASWNATTAMVRHNFVVMSDWSTSDYDDIAGSPNGIRIYDEAIGGDNSAADISVYGNIIINRHGGVWVFSSLDRNNPFGSVKVYNNTIIDSHNSNLNFFNPDEFLAVYIYNNSSILYDRTGSKHANMINIGRDWHISYNHFWTKGGSPNIPSMWRANYVTTDPKLPGEPALNWDGLTGTNYFHKIDFDNHLYISSYSSLANAGKRLGWGYNSKFLTEGTDFSKLKFQREPQPDSAKWCIGAIVPKDTGKESDNPPPPSDLKITF